MTALRQSAAEQRRAAGSAGTTTAARSLAFPAQLRAVKRQWNGKSMYNLVGIASVTDTPYEMYDEFGPYDEIIDHAAFDDTLAADPDVAFLVNHRGMTMARTRAREGSERTLSLRMVDEGLESSAWLNPERQDVKDLIVAIDDGNIDQMSFAFMLVEGWWSDDFTTFKITKTDLDRGDTSAVNYGANPYTSIAARSREILADLTRLPAGARRAALARLSEPQDQRPPAERVAEQRTLTQMHTAYVQAWLAQQ